MRNSTNIVFAILLKTTVFHLYKHCIPGVMLIVGFCVAMVAVVIAELEVAFA